MIARTAWIIAGSDGSAVEWAGRLLDVADCYTRNGVLEAAAAGGEAQLAGIPERLFGERAEALRTDWVESLLNKSTAATSIVSLRRKRHVPAVSSTDGRQPFIKKIRPKSANKFLAS